MLGARLVATDYSTCAVTGTGRIIFGAGCGAVTVFIRYFGGYNEGVSFAILIMNMLVYYIDRLTRPRVFGTGGRNTTEGEKEKAAK
jgi:electron transport complex protein RnfD